MEERVKLAEKVKRKAIAEAEKAKDEYLAMAGYKLPEDPPTAQKPDKHKALAQKNSKKKSNKDAEKSSEKAKKNGKQKA